MIKKQSILKKVGHELKVNPPAVLAKTLRKKGAHAAEAQRRAILLSKSRSEGASLPEGAGGVNLAHAANPDLKKEGFDLMREVGAL